MAGDGDEEAVRLHAWQVAFLGREVGDELIRFGDEAVVDAGAVEPDDGAAVPIGCVVALWGGAVTDFGEGTERHECPAFRDGTNVGLSLEFPARAGEALGEELLQEGLFQFGGQRQQPLLLLHRPLHHAQHRRDLLLFGERWVFQCEPFEIVSGDTLDRCAALVRGNLLLESFRAQLICEKAKIVFLTIHENTRQILIDCEIEAVDGHVSDANTRSENEAILWNDARGRPTHRVLGNELFARRQKQRRSYPLTGDPWHVAFPKGLIFR